MEAPVQRFFVFQLLALALLVPFPALGQARNTNQQVKAARKDVTEAETKLQEARKAAAQAAAESRKAQSEAQAAENAVEKARQKAVAVKAEELGYARAMADRDVAHRQVEALREGVLEKLKQTADYKKASQEAEAAGETLRALLNDRSLPENEKRQRQQDLSAVARRPSDMQKAALADSAELQQAARRSVEADAALARIQTALNRAVDSDKDLQKAELESRQARSSASKAQADANRAQQAVKTAQNNLERERSQLQKAEAADRKADQQKKNKKND